jgi:PPOX class probable FMN-dependent enzyme
MSDVVPDGYRKLDAAEVRATIGEPTELVRMKIRPSLDEHCRAFIEHSPFLALGTIDADGKSDVSPRGDPPGFVKVLDDQTLAIPDRPGNKLTDSLSNILETGSVGLLFLVPGVGETLRVNGRASITDDPELLASMTVQGKPPKLAIVVQVREAYVHCAKAFKRSKLWDPDTQIDRSELPSIGRMIRDQVPSLGMEAEEIDEYAETAYRAELY